MMKVFFIWLGISGILFGALEIRDVSGKSLEVVSDGKVLVRYQYEHDVSTPERHQETYKPYLHVFDELGEKPITKGPGGEFPHHRGLFVGWNRIQAGGKSFDRWHMKGGDIVHQKFLSKEVEDGVAKVTALIHWMGEGDEVLIAEERSLVVREGMMGARVAIEWTSEMKAVNGDLELKGDPEHAGVQFRAANEVDRKKTTYLLPEGVEKVQGAKDLRWVGMNFELGEKKYGVVHLNGAGNPEGTVYSAYRDYGRFGAFFERGIKGGESLTMKYGFLIFDGNLPEVEKIEEAWSGWSF